MKFFAVSLLALGASAAPATFTQHHHTLGTTGVTAHKQVIATPFTTSTTFNKAAIVAPITQTYNKVVSVAEPVSYVNNVQSVGYVQPAVNTYVKQATAYVQPAITSFVQKPAVQYVQPAVQYVQPAVTSFVQKPAIQYVAPTTQYVAPAVTATQYQTSEVQLPVHQVDRTVQYLDVPHIEKPAAIQTIRIAPSTNPLHIHFDSQGSQLSTSQSHLKAAPAQPKFEEAHDDPSHLQLQISKKVHQTVTETVYPERKIEQVIAPLTESVNTVVSRATHERTQYAAPEVHHQQTIVKAVEVPKTYVHQAVEVPKTYVQAVEIPKTYVQAVETVPATQTIVEKVPVTQTYVQDQTYLQGQNYVQAVPTTYAVQPAETTYVQGQSFEYKPVTGFNFGTTVVKPVAQISTLTKDVVEKAAEY